MTWDQWIPARFLIKQELWALECCISQDRTDYHLVHLKKKGTQLEIISSQTLTDALVLPDKIQKQKLPMLVVINGRGIILKKIELNEGSAEDLQEIIHANLPGVNVSEFYVQLYRQGISAFLTFGRKDVVDRFLGDLSRQKVEVIGVYLGAASIIGLKPIWSNIESLETNQQLVTISNNVVEGITPLQKEAGANEMMYRFGDLPVSSKYLLGLSAGLAYFFGMRLKEDNRLEFEKLETQHIEKNKLRFFVMVMVGTALLISVLNMFYYTSIYDRNSKLDTELFVYQGKQDEINELLNQYQQNKSLIEGAGFSDNNSLSEYGDKIGTTIPAEVTLTDLHFNPKKQQDDAGDDSLVKFDNRILIIKGNCGKSMIINEWLNVLKAQKFVSDANLEKYAYNSNEFSPNFEIRLSINP